MGIFEDVFLKAKSAAKTIGEKTGHWVDVSKLQVRLMELKSELKNEFNDLGKTTYHSHKNEIKDDISIKNGIERIDSLLGQIDNLKTEIALMKDKIICKNCGKDNEIDASFCSRCGENVTEIYEEEINRDEIQDDFKDFDENEDEN